MCTSSSRTSDTRKHFLFGWNFGSGLERSQSSWTQSTKNKAFEASWASNIVVMRDVWIAHGSPPKERKNTKVQLPSWKVRIWRIVCKHYHIYFLGNNRSWKYWISLTLFGGMCSPWAKGKVHTNLLCQREMGDVDNIFRRTQCGRHSQFKIWNK